MGPPKKKKTKTKTEKHCAGLENEINN